MIITAIIITVTIFFIFIFIFAPKYNCKITYSLESFLW